MSKLTNKLSNEWQDVANLVLGLWLTISPWALGYAGERSAMTNAFAVGLIISLAAAAALYAFQQWEEWVNIALAAWLVASPWIVGFSWSQVATWNQVTVGVLVAALALWSTTIDHDKGNLSPRS